MEKKLTDRFLKYVKVDTQSAEDATTCPSTEKQWNLAKMLRDELQAMQLEEIELDEHCYLYATLPANTDKPLPTIGFIAHMDTSPDCSGSDVEPCIVRDYDGSDIVLDKQAGIVTRVSQFPELKRHIGEDLIVTNGHTLLGADDKAGIAEIVTAMEYLISHPEIQHGKVRIAFTPDEEIGKGAHLFDVQKFGCDWAYTMDGSEEGELEYENFNAASAKVTVSGINVHPGYAKGKMLNAVLVANEFVSLLPENERPEKTEGYEGFFHITDMNATVEQATVSLIIRDHNAQVFALRKQIVYDTVERLNQQYGPNVVRLEMTDQYQNMVSQISDKPHIIQVAEEAIRQACGHCKVIPIRGGTDGAQLSFRGLPCPNIFAGGLNFHGRHEFVTVQNMQKATQAIINIIRLVAQSGNGKQ